MCCSPWGHKESDTTEWLNWISILLKLIIDQKQGPYPCSLLLLLDLIEHLVLRKYILNEWKVFLGVGWGYVCSLGENEKVYCNTFSLNRLNCHWQPYPFLFSQNNCLNNPGICHVLYLPVLRPTLGTMMFWSQRMGRVQRELWLWWQVNAVWDPALLLTSWDHSNVTWKPEPRFYIFSKKIIIVFIFGCAGSLLLHGLSSSCVDFFPVMESRGCSLIEMRGLLLLWSTGSRCLGFSSCSTWAQ